MEAIGPNHVARIAHAQHRADRTLPVIAMLRKAGRALPVSSYCSIREGIGPFRASLFELFARIFARWRAEALLALTTMTACSQRVELRAA